MLNLAVERVEIDSLFVEISHDRPFERAQFFRRECVGLANHRNEIDTIIEMLEKLGVQCLETRKRVRREGAVPIELTYDPWD